MVRSSTPSEAQPLGHHLRAWELPIRLVPEQILPVRVASAGDVASDVGGQGRLVERYLQDDDVAIMEPGARAIPGR